MPLLLRIPEPHFTLTPDQSPVRSGKYLITPLSRPLDDGAIASSVSIRSGRGSATTDRVLRFTRTFTTQDAALRYARAEGLAWVRNASGSRTGWKPLFSRILHLARGARLAHG